MYVASFTGLNMHQTALKLESFISYGKSSTKASEDLPMLPTGQAIETTYYRHDKIIKGICLIELQHSVTKIKIGSSMKVYFFFYDIYNNSS